jgi:hypothetical protein
MDIFDQSFQTVLHVWSNLGNRCHRFFDEDSKLGYDKVIMQAGR